MARLNKSGIHFDKESIMSVMRHEDPEALSEVLIQLHGINIEIDDEIRACLKKDYKDYKDYMSEKMKEIIGRLKGINFKMSFSFLRQASKLYAIEDFLSALVSLDQGEIALDESLVAYLMGTGYPHLVANNLVIISNKVKESDFQLCIHSLVSNNCITLIELMANLCKANIEINKTLMEIAVAYTNQQPFSEKTIPPSRLSALIIKLTIHSIDITRSLIDLIFKYDNDTSVISALTAVEKSKGRFNDISINNIVSHRNPRLLVNALIKLCNARLQSNANLLSVILLSSWNPEQLADAFITLSESSIELNHGIINVLKANESHARVMAKELVYLNQNGISIDLVLRHGRDFSFFEDTSKVLMALKNAGFGVDEESIKIVFSHRNYEYLYRVFNDFYRIEMLMNEGLRLAISTPVSSVNRQEQHCSLFISIFKALNQEGNYVETRILKAILVDGITSTELYNMLLKIKQSNLALNRALIDLFLTRNIQTIQQIFDAFNRANMSIARLPLISIFSRGNFMEISCALIRLYEARITLNEALVSAIISHNSPTNLVDHLRQIHCRGITITPRLLNLITTGRLPIQEMFLDGNLAAFLEQEGRLEEHSSEESIKSNEEILDEINYTGDIPIVFCCAISTIIMTKPVYYPGQPNIFYEEKNIRRWLSTRNTNPYTREPLKLTDLKPAQILQYDIEEFVQHVMEKEQQDAQTESMSYKPLSIIELLTRSNSLFHKIEDSLIIENRGTDASIQRAYDMRYGLVPV